MTSATSPRMTCSEPARAGAISGTVNADTRKSAVTSSAGTVKERVMGTV